MRGQGGCFGGLFGGGVKNLAVEIGNRNPVAINQPLIADTSSGEVGRRNRSKAAATYNPNVGLRKFSLSGGTNFPEGKLAGVAVFLSHGRRRVGPLPRRVLRGCWRW